MKELYQNSDKACDFLKEMVKEDQNFKKNWARIAKRCVGFANGEQNTYPLTDSKGLDGMVINNQHVITKDSGIKGYQVNEIAPICRTLVAFMCGGKPAATCESDSHSDPRAKNIAKLSEKVVEAKYDIDNEYDNSCNSAFWAMTTGTVIAKDFWDKSKGDFRNINPTTGEPEGDNEVAILTPFQMMLDNSVTNFDKLIWTGEKYLMDCDWAREVYGYEGQGYTGKGAEIQETNDLTDTLLQYEQMKMAVPFLAGKVGNKKTGKCLIEEFHIKPNHQYPLGRYIIKAGGVVVFDTPPEMGNPYFMEYSPQMWHPYSFFGWERYVGRLLWKSLVEQLVPLQMRLNELNAAIVQNAGTLAKPNILTAKGSLEKGTWDGGGYKVFLYNHMPQVNPPQILGGAPLPAQFFNERNEIVEQMVRVAGTNFVMSGQAPKGVTAAAAIQQLLENANSQQSDLANRWHIYHEQRFTKKLRLLHKFNQLPNNNISNKLKLITDGALKTQIHDFVGARDLSDGVYVKIEASSMLQKSTVAERTAYGEAFKNGGFGPAIAEDSPRGNKLRNELMEKMGLEGLQVEDTIEVKKAKWENDLILQGKMPPVGQYDITPIHMMEHRLLVQDPYILENYGPDIINLAMQHMAMHEQAEQQKAMEQMQQQAMMQGQQQQMQLENAQKLNEQVAPMPQNLPAGLPPDVQGPIQ